MGSIRVLIVDDAVVVRRMLSDIISSDPILTVVGTAANGKIALKKRPLLKPDVVILDMDMPEMPEESVEVEEAKDEDEAVEEATDEAVDESKDEVEEAEEVEEAVKKHPEVYDCLVVGLKDEKFGQRVVALASLESKGVLDEGELIDFTREQLSGYKLPKQVLFVEEVMRAPNGKANYKWAKEEAEKNLG